MSWAPLLRRASQELHIPPAEFWRLSIREWRAISGDNAGLHPLGRADLDALMAEYPDHLGPNTLTTEPNP